MVQKIGPGESRFVRARRQDAYATADAGKMARRREGADEKRKFFDPAFEQAPASGVPNERGRTSPDKMDQKWAKNGTKGAKTGQKRDKMGQEWNPPYCGRHELSGVSSRRFSRSFHRLLNFLWIKGCFRH